MAYLEPPWFVRTVFNRIARLTGMSGAQTITVAGRTSGQPQRIPVIPVDVGDRRYLVSTRGEAEWVKNVRTHPELKVGRTAFTAQEVPVADRGAVLAAYRAKAGRAVDGYFRRLPDDADHPVFVLTVRSDA
jgi:deazaflavin-dependent oxidoreductase (nitroreductase family)